MTKMRQMGDMADGNRELKGMKLVSHPVSLFLISLGCFLTLNETQAKVSPSDQIYAHLPGWLSLDFSIPYTLHGEAVTIGFEAEFKGPQENQLVGPSDEHSRTPYPKFDYLEKYVQGSGQSERNMEVDSVPNIVLDVVESQMNEVKETLGRSLKGFHVHFRVPAITVTSIGKEVFNGWISRLSDAVVFWRLQHRNPFFVLATSTTRRLTADDLSQRGSLRVEMIKGKVDIEVRGYMGDVEECMRMVQIILFGLKHPQYIKGFTDFQRFAEHPRHLRHELASYVQRRWNRNLNTAEGTALNILDSIDPSRHFPLLPFELAPYFSDEQKRAFIHARETFLEQTIDLLPLADGQTGEKAFLQAYGLLMKKWAQELNLYDAIINTALMSPDTDDRFILPETDAIPYLRSNTLSRGSTLSSATFRVIHTEKLVEWFLSKTELLVDPSLAGQLLATRIEELSDQTIMDLILSPSDNMNRARSDVFGFASFARLDDILELRWSRDIEFNRTAVARVVGLISDPPFNLCLKIVRSGAELRSHVISALKNMPVQNALKLSSELEKQDLSSDEVRLIFYALKTHASSLTGSDLQKIIAFNSPHTQLWISSLVASWFIQTVRTMGELDRALSESLDSSTPQQAINVLAATRQLTKYFPRTLRLAVRHADPLVRFKALNAVVTSDLRSRDILMILAEARYDQDPAIRSEAHRQLRTKTATLSFRDQFALRWNGFKNLLKGRRMIAPTDSCADILESQPPDSTPAPIGVYGPPPPQSMDD